MLAICVCCASSAADDDQARKLKVLEKEVCGKAFAISGSGVVWTFVPDGAPRFHEGKRVSATQPLFLGYDDDLESIMRPAAKNRIAFFDQGVWQVVPWVQPLSSRDRNGPYGRIVAGVDNTALVVGHETTVLLQGTRVIDHGELFDLVKRHSALIRKSFGLGVPHPIRPDRWGGHTSIVADPQGRIWCLHDDGLRVLIDDQWLDCRESLIKAGSRYGQIKFIVPGPDHRYLYVGDNKLRHDGGVSFIAKVEGNQVAFQSTHHAIESMGQYPAVREQNDAIWIASPEGRSAGVSDFYSGQSAVRVGPTGQVTSILRMSGYPLLSDPLGNIWLGGIRGGPKNQINTVRDGKVVQKLTAPVQLSETSHNRDYLPIFCNARGSVYVHTPEHELAHFVADKQSPNRYQLAERYVLDKGKGLPQAFSVQGYCISLVADDDVRLKQMYLTKIP